MVEFLKEWSDYIIGIPALIITVWITWLIYNRQKRHKKLGFEEVLNYNMFDINDEVKEKISITYNNEKAENLRLIVLKIVNNGNVPILKADYEKDIQIAFDKDAKLIDAEIIEKAPENIDLTLKIDSDKILIEPCLINPNDNFSLRIILNSAKRGYSIDSRIADIDKINAIERKNFKPRYWFFVSFMPFFGVAIFTLIAVNFIIKSDDILDVVLIMCALGASIIAILDIWSFIRKYTQ